MHVLKPAVLAISKDIALILNTSHTVIIVMLGSKYFILKSNQHGSNTNSLVVVCACMQK